MKHELNPPAIVRAAEDELSAIAKRINAEHVAGDKASKSSLLHFRNAGRELLKATERLGHGKFGAWLKRNVQCSQDQVERYMKVAKHWGKIRSERNLSDAVQRIAELRKPAQTQVADQEPAHEPRPEVHYMKVVMPDEPDEKPVPKYISLRADRTQPDGGYRETKQVLSNKELMAEVRERFRKEIESVLSRYEMLKKDCESVRKAAGIGKD